MGSKGKKRMILPTRPDPPSVEHVLEDIRGAPSSDPLFTLLQSIIQEGKTEWADSSMESQYAQSRRYLELNGRLQEAQAHLVSKREELRAAGAQLEHSVAEVKGTAAP